jgi:hypothetical protein
MKRIVLIFITIFALLAGCQKTPDQPVVIQKDLEQMIEKGMTESESATSAPAETGMDYAALCAHYGVPERFLADFTDQGVEVHADIAIELPGTTALPMARVEAARFSQEQVSALWEALCGDTPMYIVPETLDKEHYQETILEFQAQLAMATNEDAIRSLNSNIDDLKKMYEAAPESIEPVPCNGTFNKMEVKHEKTDAASGTQTYLNATSDPYALRVMYSVNTLPTAMSFTVFNDVDYENTSGYSYVDKDGNTQNIVPSSGSSLTFQREENLCRYGLDGQILADVTALSLSGGAAEGCLLETTPQQAREVVEKLMADTGMGDMVIDRVALYTSKEAPWSGVDMDGKLEMMEQMGVPRWEDQPETHAYVFRLLRQVNGVKVESDHDSSMTRFEEAAIGKEWMYEMLTLAVDDGGVANLFWTGPLSVTEVLTADTAIKPWSEIENVFEKMIIIQNIPNTQFEEDLTIDVARVCLSLQRIMERDSFTTGLLVPVWNFYGTRTFTDEQGKVHVADEGYFPLLSVNAIDGSVIDPLQGY